MAFGAGSHGLGGCARVEVFAFSLLDDLDDGDDGSAAAAAASSTSDARASASLIGGAPSSGSQQKGHHMSRFQGLPVGGGGLATKGELKTLAFLDTPRVSFVTALQVKEKILVEDACVYWQKRTRSHHICHWKELFEALNLTYPVSFTLYPYSGEVAYMLLRCCLAHYELTSVCSLVRTFRPFS